MEKKKKDKKEKSVTPHWQEMIAVWFDFCRAHFNQKPSFDGSAPRDLKSIIQALINRAKDENIEWTLKIASGRLGNFLLTAYHHKDSSGKMWLQEHFILSNINRQKEIIFFKRKPTQDAGRQERSEEGDRISSSAASTTIKPTGNFGKL